MKKNNGHLRGKNVVVISFDRWSEQFDRRSLDKARWLSGWGASVTLICAGQSSSVFTLHSTNVSVKVCGTDANSLASSGDRLFSVVRLARIIKQRCPSSVYSIIKNLASAFALPSRGAYQLSNCMTRAIIDSEPEMIFCEDLPTLISLKMSPIDLSKTKVALDAHELYSEIGSLPEIYRRWMQKTQKKLIPTLDLIISTSSHTEGFLKSQVGPGFPKSIVMSNCPAPDNLQSPLRSREIRKARNQFHEDHIVAFVGDLTVERNVENLVATFSSTELSDVRLLLLGHIEDRLRQKLTRISGDNITFMDPIPSGSVRGFLDGVDRIVIPYLPTSKNMELCFPNKLGDAIEWGIPVLASRGLVQIESMFRRVRFGALVSFENPSVAKFQVRDDLEGGNYASKTKDQARKLWGWERNYSAFESALKHL